MYQSTKHLGSINIDNSEESKNSIEKDVTPSFYKRYKGNYRKESQKAKAENYKNQDHIPFFEEDAFLMP